MKKETIKSSVNERKVVGYIRVSTDTQDLEKQKHLLLEYAHSRKFIIDEMIEVEVSSKKDIKKRKIDILLSKIESGDILLVAELSRLGRNMLEVLNLVNSMVERGIQIIFVRQPELSTNGTHGKLLLAIYSYFAETEREFISLRTKQGLAAAKANGKILGRPAGSRNKNGRRLDKYMDQIIQYRSLKIPLRSILKIINNQEQKPISYSALKFYVNSEKELLGEK